MPNLAALIRRGVRADFHTLRPMLSPLLWTSIATGVTPERHGILDFISPDPRTGEMVPVSSTFRRVPAFWNILTQYNVSQGIVAWLADLAGGVDKRPPRHRPLRLPRLRRTGARGGPGHDLAAGIRGPRAHAGSAGGLAPGGVLEALLQRSRPRADRVGTHGVPQGRSHRELRADREHRAHLDRDRRGLAAHRRSSRARRVLRVDRRRGAPDDALRAAPWIADHRGGLQPLLRRHQRHLRTPG